MTHWPLLVALLAGAGALIVFLVVRFNQLSMNRSLTAEALRQFDFARSSRLSLVPAYLVAVREVVGDTAEASRLENAADSAQRAAGRAALGPAEYLVTSCVTELDAQLRRARTEAGGARRAASRELACDLLRQLRTQETQIGAAARHHNSSVRAYEERRTLLTSMPLRWAFRPAPEIDYAPVRTEADTELTAPPPGSENYRPGRVSEDL